MFAKGPMPGATPKQDAMALLPKGTRCRRVEAMGIRGCVIELPDGRSIASAGNAPKAWDNAHGWALRQMEKSTGAPMSGTTIEFEAGCNFITARKDGEVQIRCNFGLTDCRDDETLDAFVARHGGADAATEYLKQCYRNK